jgi:hypothetical protein
MRIQNITPIRIQEVNNWLRENPRIEVKGFSVAAGSDEPGSVMPLSICAILYEPSALPDEGDRPALAEAERLIRAVVSEQAPEVAPEQP